MSHAWKHGSMVNDGRIIIPINQKSIKYHIESIHACGSPLHIRSSTVPMSDHFPIELGFCITVPKAQGRTINKVIASLSEHPCPFIRFRYEQVYIILLRIKEHQDLELLLKMNNRNTLKYISTLEKDPFPTYYFAGFQQISYDRLEKWDSTLAAKAAGFI